MLTDDEKHEIDEEASRYLTRDAAAPEALKIVQRRTGWISDETLNSIARYLEMTPAELDGIATFYNLIYREPVGRHVILICDSVSCWVMGYETMREHLYRRLGIQLGETTADGRFTLIPMACLGACDHAPAMMIDNDFHGDLTPEKIDAVLARYP
ncbi:MAG: NADH-quinone oxidoreductase subunit NuoE [Thermoguttaceae bacterium]|jgi:NADH-quinone oxidoreductase subunit E